MRGCLMSRARAAEHTDGMLTPTVKEIHRAVEPVVRDTFIASASASAAAPAAGAFAAQPALRATIRAYSAS
jgi:hypothetical protein